MGHRARAHRTALVAALSVLTACGGSGELDDLDPDAVLAEGRAALDAAQSVRFELASEGVPNGGTALRGGEGDLARPDTFTGTLDVSVDGFGAMVEVRSSGGVFQARLPFTDGFAETDPAELGFGDPAGLIDPEDGISALLVSGTDARVTGDVRTGSDVLDVVEVTLPGQLVADLLTSADPEQDVRGLVSLTRDGREVRQVVLTGPFYDPDELSTYTLILTDYT